MFLFSARINNGSRLRPARNRFSRRRRQDTLQISPFIQYIARSTTAIVVGYNGVNFTMANLASDLTATSSRLLRLRKLVVRFYPFDVGKIPPSAQILINDVATGSLLPCTSVRPLSLVNPVVLTAVVPPGNWLGNSSAVVVAQLNFESSSVCTAVYDLEAHFEITRDTLT